MTSNKVIHLVQEGMGFEKAGNITGAKECFENAWESAETDYDKCVAAHFVARHQSNIEDELEWNLTAVEKANLCDPEQVRAFYPSLFYCVGLSYEKLVDVEEANKYFLLAQDRIPDLNSSPENIEYNKNVIAKIKDKLKFL